MAAFIFSIFVAFAALVGFALSVAWVRRSPPIGLALLCLIIIPLWEVPFPSPLVTLSGLSIYPADVITPILFTVGVLEVKQLRANLRGWILPWVLFGVLIAVALLRGFVAFEPATAVHEARPLLYFFGAMTWVLGIRPDRLRLHAVSLILGWVLVLVALYHGLTYGFGGSSSVISTRDGVIQTGRILLASQSMALLLCAATVFLGPSGLAKDRQQFYTASALVFGGVVVIAQQRSVWGAGALGVAAVLILSRQRGRKHVFVTLIPGTCVVLIAWFSGILGGSQILDSASNRSTYEWRTTSWQILISEAIARGPVTVVSGEPFGSNVSFRQIPTTNGWTSVQAHNWYVTIFLYLGLLGLMVFVAILAAALVNSRTMPSVWTFVPAAIAAYSWAYSLEWYLAPWLGAAVSVALGAGRIAEGPAPKFGLVAKPDAARPGVRA